MSLIHGKEVDDLKIKMIRNILQKFKESYNDTNKTLYLDVVYDKLNGLFFYYDFKNHSLNIDLVGLRDTQGMGLCTVLCIFYLRKLYNLVIKKMGDMIHARVCVESDAADIATKCYLSAYLELGFTSDKEKPNNKQNLYFKKEKPIGGWKKINEVFKYEYKRLNIKYYIGEKSISVVKI
jgi:hypothetical protein